MEFLIFIGCGFLTIRFFMKWYGTLISAWPPERYEKTKWLLGCLPWVTISVTWLTLIFLASYDVRDSFFYTLYYLLMGIAWQHICLFLMAVFFDMSWRDDALYANNKAALCTLCGGFFGASLIYNGANIGDGPGWWCVVFAGGLGLFAWFVLAIAANKLTGIFERVTVERDLGAGVRFGAYLVASGLILGRASGGDWTSFGRTIVEFLDGWPVLPLAALMILVEYRYLQKSKDAPEFGQRSNALVSSILWAVFYIAVAIAAIIVLPPFAQNPMY